VHVTDSVRRDTGEIRVRSWSYPFWEQIRQRPQLYAGATAWSFERFNVAESGETQFVDGLWVDAGFFDALGVHAATGRTFSAADNRPGGGPDGPVAVIGYGYGERQFGGAAAALGRTLRLDGVTFTIVGVAPAGFFGLEVGRTFDVAVPLGAEPLIRRRDSALGSASTNFLSIVARLPPGQSIDAATVEFRRRQAEINAAAIGDATPEEREVLGRRLASPLTLLPASTGFSYLREAFQRPLLITGGVVVLVLLIGCVNVANLLLARALSRRHELSVQAALGAPRWRLVRQLFAESAALSVSGAALGMFVATVGAPFLVSQLSTPSTRVVLDLPIDGRVLAFTTAVAVLTTLMFGIAPAFRVAGARPIEAIQERGRTVTTGRGGLMGWLVGVQVALSMVLLVGAGLFLRSFATLTARDLGIEPDRVLVATIDPQRADIEPALRVALYERVREAVLQTPDVAEAGISFLTPLGGGGFTPAVAVETPSGPVRTDPNGDVFGNLISSGWFRTFGTPVTSGRDFTDGDRKGAPRVAIVNEAFVRRFLTAASPLGRALTIYPNTPRALQVVVVGVAADAVYSSVREAAPPTWYLPMAQFDIRGFPFDSARLSMRTSGAPPAALTKAVTAAALTVNPHLSLTFRSFGEDVRGSLTLDRVMAQVAGFFGALALLLAGLGLYGVTAHAISRRRTEIGIRVALGARPADVVVLVLARMSLLLGAGVVAGAALTLWASKFVAGLLYGLVPTDPTMLAGAAVVLSTTGIVATWIPARRAARMDPLIALRES
jgi:putative ABC transport system permease protein